MMVKLIKSLVVLLFCGCSADLSAQQTSSLSDFPFWQTMAGWWESNNTYVDADMNYLVRSYNSLIHIQLDGRVYRETEHRFYPAGQATGRYGNGLMGPGEGIEVIVKYTGQLIDDAGTVGMVSADHTARSWPSDVTYHMLSNNDAVRVNTNNATKLDSYRFYITVVNPNRRYRSNFGLISEGEENLGGLRAFILYRDRRIDSSTFEVRRSALRAKHVVKVLSVADPDKPGFSLVARLD